MKNFISILCILNFLNIQFVLSQWQERTMFQCTSQYGIPSQRLFHEKGTCQHACAGHNRCVPVISHVITHPVYGAPIAVSTPYSASFATGSSSSGVPVVSEPLASGSSHQVMHVVSGPILKRKVGEVILPRDLKENIKRDIEADIIRDIEADLKEKNIAIRNRQEISPEDVQGMRTTTVSAAGVKHVPEIRR